MSDETVERTAVVDGIAYVIEWTGHEWHVWRGDDRVGIIDHHARPCGLDVPTTLVVRIARAADIALLEDTLRWPR
jgi:hypothetical protein